MTKYLQTPKIAEYFDLSKDWFEKRKNDGTFKQGIHYIIPPNKSKTKKVVLYNVNAIEKWMLSSNSTNSSSSSRDSDVDKFLSRIS